MLTGVRTPQPEVNLYVHQAAIIFPERNKLEDITFLSDKVKAILQRGDLRKKTTWKRMKKLRLSKKMR